MAPGDDDGSTTEKHAEVPFWALEPRMVADAAGEPVRACRLEQATWQSATGWTRGPSRSGRCRRLQYCQVNAAVSMSTTYIHSAHAGNRGDVVKHAVLVAVLDELLKTLPSSRGLSFCDAFSGNGEYLLTGKGQWKAGIGALKASDPGKMLPRVDTYLAACWLLTTGGSLIYRGSSLTAARRASSVGRAISIRAWDTNPSCVTNLLQVLGQQTPKALVKALTGPMPPGKAAGVDLLLVDPPRRKGWAAVVRRLVPKGSEPNALIIWLPVNGKRSSSSWIPTTTAATPPGMMSPLWSVEVLWDTPVSAQPMVGCELLIVLPPPALRAAAEAAAEVVLAMGAKWSMRLRQV
jgi:23S rRNA A2030 N6-methylase RlmJ